MAVAFFGSTSWSKAAGEPDPGDLVSMLDHAAIVETIALACEDSRPDLAAAFKEAQQRWWVRNAQIHQTVASLEREIGTPRAKAFLDYFNSLRRSLQQQIQDQRHAGDAEYAALRWRARGTDPWPLAGRGRSASPFLVAGMIKSGQGREMPASKISRRGEPTDLKAIASPAWRRHLS